MDKRVLNSVFVVAIGLLAIVVILVLYNPTGNQQVEGRKTYIGNSQEECSRIRFICAEEKEYFTDEKGCGCKNPGIDDFEKCAAAGNQIMESYPRQCRAGGKTFVEEAKVCTADAKQCPDGSYVSRDANNNCEFFTCPEKEKVFCEPGQKNAEACIALYKPVCGWFNPGQIQCVKYPCAQKYSNSCFACADGKVSYYTEGECPA
ncbi:MAG TPA: hypothetical protein HA282_05275 [Nanoarchaeota archaeon]|nr:MAG: Kazal-type serine protease inhibitor protein [archaeon GW2011_AR6]HIH17600.1 hypothetical protein [Nanoarchaeota archaeon]HIH66593.1 hypothetical protein [Nanoarchaeota archaeon]